MKKAKRKQKVMVFGVFDLLHLGHISFLKQARQLGDFLIVSVARDVNAKKVKGYLPVHTEKQRIRNLKRLKFVSKAVLGGVKNPWPHIKNENPDVIALGYDQKAYVMQAGIKQLQRELWKRKIKAKVVRLKAFKLKIYKSSRLRNNPSLLNLRGGEK